MSGAIPPLPNTASWRCAYAGTSLPLPFMVVGDVKNRLKYIRLILILFNDAVSTAEVKCNYRVGWVNDDMERGGCGLLHGAVFEFARRSWTKTRNTSVRVAGKNSRFHSDVSRIQLHQNLGELYLCKIKINKKFWPFLGTKWGSTKSKLHPFYI
jgi:hypothetical protein